MKLLALDTSTLACSAALAVDGQVHARYELAPQRHGELILPMIEGLLAEAGVRRDELDAIAFGRGPGAFTGLRIAAGVTQGIAYALDLPVIPVSTLAALAQGAVRERGARQVLAAMDARMDEIYWGAYRAEEGGVRLLGSECVVPAAELSLPDASRGWHGAGDAWGRYAEPLRARFGDAIAGCEPERFPHAYDVAVLALSLYQQGQAVPAERALPVYLRDRVAVKPGT